MRLDKYLCESTELTRTEAKRVLKRGNVTVDGTVVKHGTLKVSQENSVCINGDSIEPIGCRYIMLNKPENFICSNVDEVHPSVLHLVDVVKVQQLHVAGRLDVDTTGLVLLTDDGQWSHHITSPKKSCPKCYRVILANALSQQQKESLIQGVQLNGEDKLTLPATVEVISECEILLTISEGKYHQVKRMLAAVGNKVVELHRCSIGNIMLDNELTLGEWRYLTAEEVTTVTNSEH